MKTKVIIIIVAVIIGLSTVLFASCLPKEKPQSKKSEEATQAETGQARGGESTQSAGEKTTKITIYFSDSEAQYLKPEIREIPQTEGLARAAILELIKGPKTEGLRSTIPSGTKLLSITIENKVAYVNFSQELVKNHPGGSAGETMTVYSVVDTLTEFPSIQKVKFLVQGKSIETLAEHLDLTEPLPRNEDIIRK